MKFADGRVTITRISKVSTEDEDVLPLDILELAPEIEKALECDELDWEGAMLRVINREGLIKLKKLRNSHQDQADMEKLAS